MVPDTDVINIIEEMSTTTQVHDTTYSSKDKNTFSSLKEKISRTAQFLQDLKLISQDCQDLEADQQDDKEKQVFNRRIVQVGAEIQDARDLLSTLCKHHLPDRHWRLVFEVVDEVDPSGSTGLLSGFDMDPSVQFFGIDWERAFGRCYGLSMQIKQLEVLLKEDPEVEIDILLINRMLRDLAAIEADVQSHSEAVLRGRLSKSQRQLIFDEQSKYAALTIVSKPSHKSSMSKSRSFRDASLKSRPVKYKRNKTTNLDKLTSSMSAHTLKCPTEEEHQAMISGADHTQCDDKKSTMVTINSSSIKQQRKNSGTFMQNVTSMFKNIR
jgi:hypothetical protein